ncbi:hypothetical protein MTR67_033824, partial [Solanum verrucosum]
DGFEDARERIRETFGKVELSPSSYDTAWVAMVPSKHSLNEPCFPQCLDWIIENQREDGSWGLNPSHPLLLKDSLSSTLACLLALSKWRVGDEQIKRGLGFIETYGWAVDSKDQISPLGFEIIFSTMIKFAEKLNLNLPLDHDIIVNLVNCKRDSTIKRLWQQKNEEIFSNVTHCAMAFRFLRMSYYDVSSDELAEFVVEEHFFATSGKYSSHVAILELHKASQLAIDHEKDDILDKINNWTRTFLEQKLLNNGFIDRMSKKEVELALRKFYTTCDRAENRRWFEDCRLDQLGLSEQFIYTTYLMSIAVVSDPEFSDARLMYAKYGMLLTMVDDLFDGFASKDELLNIIELVERWDDYASVGYNSERVKVFFSVFYKSIEELATIAEIKQGRSVKNHLINLREQGESSMNLVTILMTQSPRRKNISEEEAIMKIKEILESNRRQLLKMVLVQKKGSQLPQLCKEIIWWSSKMICFTYSHGDEYKFPEEMKNYIDEVIYKPLNH